MEKRSGLTLVELLIAASIFSVIILSVYSAFYTGILSYQKINSAFEVYQAARVIFNRIEADLKNSFVYTPKDSRFQGSPEEMDFFSVIDTYAQDKTFILPSHIKYTFSDSVLKRALATGVEALKKDLNAEGQDLSSDIKEVSFQYAYITGKPEEPYIWQEAWPKEESQKAILPEAIKIKLILAYKEKQQDKRETTMEFNKVVSLLR